MPVVEPSCIPQSELCLFAVEILTFAHQIPLPSTALSHTRARASKAPALHDAYCEEDTFSSDRGPVLSVVYAQIATHATALVNKECFVDVSRWDRMEARKKAINGVVVVVVEGFAAASCLYRDSSDGMLLLSSIRHLCGVVEVFSILKQDLLRACV